MLHIALTGGIGSGKSTVASMFGQHGAPVIDADEIARDLVRRDEPAYHETVRAFGTGILDTNREIDRQRLGERIFSDASERRILEGIIHPRVRQEIIARTTLAGFPYCIIVVPLLLEANMQDLADRILVIECSEQLQIARVRTRSSLSEESIRRIMATQASSAERRLMADDVIVNDTDLADLQRQVDRLHGQYLALAALTRPPSA